jgi:hypothetical protein
MNLIELGQIDNCKDLYVDIKKYVSHHPESTKIIQLTHSLIYINADFFRKELNNFCPLKEKIYEKSICENVIIF